MNGINVKDNFIILSVLTLCGLGLGDMYLFYPWKKCLSEWYELLRKEEKNICNMNPLLHIKAF